MGDRHGWNSWNEYLSAHDGFIRHFEFFIAKNELEIIEVNEAIYIRGTLYCLDGIEIEISKRLETRKENGWVLVRTAEYKYHVMRRVAGEVINIFRYDNVHLHESHFDKHHRHDYRPAEQVAHVGYNNWPTLGDVISEVHTWWLDYAENK